MKLHTWIERFAPTPFDVPRQEQERVLQDVRGRLDTRDPVQAAMAQYLCARSTWSGASRAARYAWARARSLKVGGTESPPLVPSQAVQSGELALLVGCTLANVPDELRARYTLQSAPHAQPKAPVGDDALVRQIRILGRGEPFFVARCLQQIAMLNGLLAHAPTTRAMVFTSEYSFYSSVQTAWCRAHGIRAINVMHGEKLFFIRDAFASYDEWWVWHSHYRNLLEHMGCTANSWHIQEPPRFAVLRAQASTAPARSRPRLTYYLQSARRRDRQQLLQLVQSLEGLTPRYEVVIRPHPLYSDKSLVLSLIAGRGIELQSPGVPITESLLGTDLVATEYSTVLFEGYITGKQLVIDDVLHPGRYDQLRELEYFGTAVPHRRLSQL